MVEGFIVSLDSVFSYLVAHLAACSWEIPSLACSELEIDGMKASIQSAWRAGVTLGMSLAGLLAGPPPSRRNLRRLLSLCRLGEGETVCGISSASCL